jgi:hypothetical protein
MGEDFGDTVGDGSNDDEYDESEDSTEVVDSKQAGVLFVTSHDTKDPEQDENTTENVQADHEAGLYALSEYN